MMSLILINDLLVQLELVLCNLSINEIKEK